MRLLSKHEQILLKITAFLFNKRANALRGEMYQACCLYVLNELGEPCIRKEVVELVAYALGVDVTDSLRLVVLEELHKLTNEGLVLLEDERYFIHKDEAMQLPDETGQKQLYETILPEMHKIAVSLNPDISKAQLSSLLDFYIEVSSIAVQHKLTFISRGYGTEEIYTDMEEIIAAALDCKERYGVDKFIDVDKFILRSLINPSEVLSDYLYTLIQVGVIPNCWPGTQHWSISETQFSQIRYFTWIVVCYLP